MPIVLPYSTPHHHNTAYAEADHDHDSDYLGITATAADSDKVDGAHASATPAAATIPIADENGKLNDWVDTSGGVTDHGALTGLSDDDHPQYVKHSLATAVSDFLVASGAGAFVKKTLAEVKAILGLGSAAYTESTDYLAANGKAADSDLLDNHDTSYFATADHNHSGVYPGVDGWIPVSATWTYASATTITVPSGAASIYSVGDKIKLNNTDLKYFYIVGVADTVLTITGGSSYTLDSDAISAVYYSKAATPLGFPQWFNYTPTVTSASGAFGTGGVTSSNSKFAINGRTLHYKYVLTVTDVGTAAVYVVATLAVNPPTGFRDTGAGLAYLTSSGAYRSDLATVLASTSMRIYKTGGTFPAVNLETMVCSGAYEI